MDVRVLDSSLRPINGPSRLVITDGVGDDDRDSELFLNDRFSSDDDLVRHGIVLMPDVEEELGETTNGKSCIDRAKSTISESILAEMSHIVVLSVVLLDRSSGGTVSVPGG